MKLIFTVIFILLITLAGFSQKNINYKDKNTSLEKRVTDLMQKMTLEEKIGQMCQYVAIEHIRETKK
ncbi:MAG: hypothetical protein L3J54_14340, partial [Draconibacterium sp.]|nr:hypothetical protein [Draconibacterium sp.]